MALTRGGSRTTRKLTRRVNLTGNALPADVPLAVSAGSSASGVETLRVKNPYLEDRKTLEKQAQWCERNVIDRLLSL